MSEEDASAVDSDSQFLAEFKDGKLQIVEVTPLWKNDKKNESSDTPMLTEADETTSAITEAHTEGQKYMQVLDTDQRVMHLDLLNLTLVKFGEADGEQSYRLVAGSDVASDDVTSDTTLTCVLRSSDDNEDGDSHDYVMVEAEGDGSSLVFLQHGATDAGLEPATMQLEAPKPAPVVTELKSSKPKLTPAEIIERAKAIQKSGIPSSTSRRGRRRAGALPPARELLASPNFKLFLYSCKLCLFKCNAVKELTRHRAEEHGNGSGKYKVGGGLITFQCARCPFRGSTNAQLAKHVNERHSEPKYESTRVCLDSVEVRSADVLVCGACGFESAERETFRHHIENEHGATT